VFLVTRHLSLAAAFVRKQQKISDAGRNSAASRNFIVDNPKMPKNNHRWWNDNL
jgi:hypothetical protein